jgi:hypothetical protein
MLTCTVRKQHRHEPGAYGIGVVENLLNQPRLPQNAKPLARLLLAFDPPQVGPVQTIRTKAALSISASHQVGQPSGGD